MPKHLDEEVASLMVENFGGTLTKLTTEQSKYINVNKKGPFQKTWITITKFMKITF